VGGGGGKQEGNLPANREEKGGKRNFWWGVRKREGIDVVGGRYSGTVWGVRPRVAERNGAREDTEKRECGGWPDFREGPSAERWGNPGRKHHDKTRQVGE